MNPSASARLTPGLMPSTLAAYFCPLRQLFQPNSSNIFEGKVRLLLTEHPNTTPTANVLSRLTNRIDLAFSAFLNTHANT